MRKFRIVSIPIVLIFIVLIIILQLGVDYDILHYMRPSIFFKLQSCGETSSSRGKHTFSSFSSSIRSGGIKRSLHCLARFRTAIIVPFKNREEHLKKFLYHIHYFLQKQNIEYGIFIIEPSERFTSFNRAKLMNIGFKESMRMYAWNCFIFHDVDLLPLDEQILYECANSPAHLSTGIDKFGYKLPYPNYFGGVCAFTKEDFIDINGASNRYWGWGGEDDDMAKRINYSGKSIWRIPSKIGRYMMLYHEKDEKINKINRCRYKLLRYTKRDWKTDGLSRVKYVVRSIKQENLYTHIKVNLLKTRSRFRNALSRC